MSVVGGDDYYPLAESSIFGQSDSEAVEKISSRTLALTAMLTGSGIVGRILLQHYPSIETVLPVAIAVGFFAGKKQGIASGLTGFYVTNFLVYGGQGAWTFYQMAGAGLAALSASYMSELSSNRIMYLGSLVAGTVAFEAVVNLGSLFFSGVGLLSASTYLIAALPFGLIHLTSTVGFGVTIYGFETKLRSVYGRD